MGFGKYYEDNVEIWIERNNNSDPRIIDASALKGKETGYYTEYLNKNRIKNYQYKNLTYYNR